METIKFREIIELFLTRTIYEIKSESEVPNINFKFDDNGIYIFKNIIEKPFVKEGYWTPNATQKDLDFILYGNSDNCLTIHVKDSVVFFTNLVNITNSLIKLYEFYGIKSSARNLAMHLMRRIWLRMGVEDFKNVELFLSNQLQFVNNKYLDICIPKRITSFYDYDVFVQTIVNSTFDETTRSMIFTINGSGETYELPHILYDVDDNGICYIYGVQSTNSQKSKLIERKLYKINKNIDNPNVHPSKVYALIFFVNQLQKKGITRIIVPGMQVLSYRYHELLSLKAKNDLIEARKQLEESPKDVYFQKKYERIKKWYNRVYNKEDLISYLKTEELFNLMYRIIMHNPNIEIMNEVIIQGDCLKMRIK